MGFRRAGLTNVVSCTLVDNTASRAVMEKAGLTYVRDFERRGLPHVLYERNKTQPCGAERG